MSVVASVARQRLASSSLLCTSQIQCRHLAARRIVATAQQARHYAKPAKKGKGKEQDDASNHGKKQSKGVSTDSLVPASQRIAASPEYKGTEGKMQGVLDWFRKEVAALETRATGRVTPALLSPVRVMLPNASGVRLEDIATVGVKEGTTLLVTVFEEHSLKYVEQAIYEAKLPGITPQRVDSRTIKVPIPKPTVETRNALYTTASRQAEDVRVQMRKLHAALLKKADVDKRSPDFAIYQGLSDKFMGELDKILAHLKKATS
ncbi:ribosome recycling factor [Lentinus brumalis]|uniref:Ribosome recycling factor n=1 Tax=Lentinus brumalis TaxID=2498619 RepID=A0A371DQ47_9APHY|nr:ribosome recycling factor [Polyporus brumalis]